MSDLEVFHLSNFDGPLDLLLNLIKDAKIDIKDIYVSEVTAQFLEITKDLSGLDYDVAFSYMVIAATLIEIKSKELLPKINLDPIEQDEGALLIRRLEEYKIIKEATIALKEAEIVGRFYRLPDKSLECVNVVFKDNSVEVLNAALSRLLSIIENTKDVVLDTAVARRETISVQEQVGFLKAKLKQQGKVYFFSLFDKASTRQFIVTTFLALLDMLKNCEITVTQKQEFDDIEIIAVTR